jgi:predicted ester cyclase
MESSSAWLGLNEGYRSGWPASPDLSQHIADMFSASDKIVTCLVGHGTHADPYGGVGAVGQQETAADFAAWRFEGGKVAEISTIQDQFAPLYQIGNLPDEVYAA